MKEYIEFNLNEEIKVKLNDRGRYLYYHHLDSLNDEIYKTTGRKSMLTPVELKYDEDGYCTLQMWQFMNIFGPHLRNGCDVPFENMNIKLIGVLKDEK